MQAWETHLDKRQLSEVALARLYAREFNHGTDGHNRLLLIAKLADLLDMGLIPPILSDFDPSKPVSSGGKPPVIKD